MTTINPYLAFNGNCEEAFTFYKSVFGVEFTYLGRFKDMPPVENCPPVTTAEGEKVMHVSLPISKETILMGCDTSEGYGPAVITGDNFSISVSTDSKEEADRIFNGLSAGGQITMAMDKTFWGSYFGMFKDQFGIQWMVNFEQNDK